MAPWNNADSDVTLAWVFRASARLMGIPFRPKVFILNLSSYIEILKSSETSEAEKTVEASSP